MSAPHRAPVAMSGASRAAFAVLGVFFLLYGLVRLGDMWEEARARLSWPRAEARILEVRPGTPRGRGGLPFLVQVEARRPDGTLDRPAAPLRVVVHRPDWSAPTRGPQAGGTLPVLLHPTEPGRMLAADELTPAWFAAILLLCSAAGGALLYVALAPAAGRWRDSPPEL